MLSQWVWKLGRLARRLWLRATLLSLMAVAAALASLLISPFVPAGLSASIGANAVDRILTIIASSMLAVTTFSLSTMVAAYSAATSNVTPRATRLMIEDTTTQNVLATFVGSFLYSLVAIITLSMGAYGERGRVVLFATTLLVIVLIVGTLLRWIDYLLRLGRVGETTEKVEEAALDAMKARFERPNLGGRALTDEVRKPASAMPAFSTRIGYVQHVDVGALEAIAVKAEGRVFVAALPGTFVDPGRPLAWCDRMNEDERNSVANAFSVGKERSFDQDPRFGLCVLAEIAQRALSSAINDPGTAIDVIGRAVRVLAVWAQPREESAEVQYPHVLVPSIEVTDIFDDVLTPIARDGAGSVEVQIRVQKAYAALRRLGDHRYAAVADAHARMALARAKAAIKSAEDVGRIEAAAPAEARKRPRKRGAASQRRSKA